MALEKPGKLGDFFAPTLWHFVRPTKFTRIRSYVKLLSDRNTQRAEMPKMFGKMRMPREKQHSTPRYRQTGTKIIL